jgi:hypothetical protein
MAMLLVHPSKGRVGQNVLAAGAAFGARETVAVYWDSTTDQPVAVARTAAGGDFKIHFHVPQSTQGAHTVIAVGQTSGRTAHVSFDVRPSMSLTRATGEPGARDALSGAGFKAGDLVTVHWASPRGPVLGRALSSATGSFAAGRAILFTVPNASAGTYAMYAVARASEEPPAVALTVRAALRVTPAHGNPGARPTVTGNGFGAGETVEVRFNCGAATCRGSLLGVATANLQGTFGPLRLVIPRVAAGRYTLGGKGQHSGNFASASYVVE